MVFQQTCNDWTLLSSLEQVHVKCLYSESMRTTLEGCKYPKYAAYVARPSREVANTLGEIV